MALLRQAYADPSERASAVGLWAGAGSLALVGGPVIGGALIAMLGWRSVFLINIPLGFVGIWLTLRHAPRPGCTVRRPVDLAGQVIAAVMLACLTGAVEQGSRSGWTSPMILAALLATCLLGAALLRIEAWSAHPMMPLDLFRSPSFSAACYVGFAANVAFYGPIFVFSLFFQEVQGRSSLATGLAFMPMTGVITVVNVAAGRLNAKFGVRPAMLIGIAMSMSGYVATFRIDANATSATIAPAFFLIGCGMALAVPSSWPRLWPACLRSARASARACTTQLGRSVAHSASPCSARSSAPRTPIL